MVKDFNNLTPEEFKAVREHLKLTQQEFALRLGYKSNAIISLKEEGKSPITGRDMLLIKSIVESKPVESDKPGEENNKHEKEV